MFSSTLKMAVEDPIPRASVRIATTAKPGAFFKFRSAYRKSCQTVCMTPSHDAQPVASSHSLAAPVGLIGGTESPSFLRNWPPQALSHVDTNRSVVCSTLFDGMRKAGEKFGQKECAQGGSIGIYDEGTPGVFVKELDSKRFAWKDFER